MGNGDNRINIEEKQIPKANKLQTEQFQIEYCKSHDARLTIFRDFDVEVESYEELIPGNTVKSYATGNREIEKAFIVFKVTDTSKGIVYYPIFSESVGRELIKSIGMKLPSKMTVFTYSGDDHNGERNINGKTIQRKEENRKMLQLIRFARSMMILHVKEPAPMGEPFKGIYNKLEKNPRYNVFEQDIKSINTAILHFIQKSVNAKNENFKNLREYIDYLQQKYPNHQLRDCDFEMLRQKMLQKYPDETTVF